MNYTREQLEAMPNLGGTAEPQSLLKVQTEDTKVWLCRGSGLSKDLYQVIVETKQNGKWRVTLRYPV